MTERRIAPAPTREEVLAVFTGDDQDRVFTAQDIADRIFQKRGGTGNPRIQNRFQPPSSVPVVHAARVKPVLADMIEAGDIMSDTGYTATRMGSVWGNVGAKTTFYALRSSAEKSIAAYQERERAWQKTRDFVTMLRSQQGVKDRVSEIELSDIGRVSVVLTVQQACALFDVSPDGWVD